MSNDNDEHLNPGNQPLAERPDEKSAGGKTSTNYRRMLDACSAVKKTQLEASAIYMYPDGRIEVCLLKLDRVQPSDIHSDDAARIEKAFAQ